MLGTVLTIKLALCLCMVTLIFSISHPVCSLCKCVISLHTAVVMQHVRPWWGLQMVYAEAYVRNGHARMLRETYCLCKQELE
jgi:hypothetical protein